MRDFVYREEKILIRCCANNVCCEDEGPGEWRCISQEIGTEDLK